jgi:hypothetical protein
MGNGGHEHGENSRRQRIVMISPQEAGRLEPIRCAIGNLGMPMTSAKHGWQDNQLVLEVFELSK